jgi:hypothetical protein
MAEQENINDKIGEILHEWFEDRVQGMKDTLRAYKIVDGSSLLPNEISVPPINPTASGINVELSLPDYYEFVDEGVKGIGDLKAGWIAAKSNGRFSFKTAFVGRKMVDSIREWGARKGRQGVTRANMSGVAFATAKKIKRTGLRQTMFFTDNFKEEHLRDLEKRIEDATGLAFELSMQIEDRAVRVRG